MYALVSFKHFKQLDAHGRTASGANGLSASKAGSHSDVGFFEVPKHFTRKRLGDVMEKHAAKLGVASPLSSRNSTAGGRDSDDVFHDLEDFDL